MWTHGETSLQRWIRHLNRFHDTIKFTAELSKTEITFLDTRVRLNIDSRQLYTELYCKPTDVNTYLDFDSAHPTSTKQSLPYSQILRIFRICQREEDFEKHSQQKLEEFVEKGYPREILEGALAKVRAQNREETLKAKPKKRRNKDTTYLISTHRPGNNIIRTAKYRT